MTPYQFSLLSTAFYKRNDVVQIAQELIGKMLHTTIDGLHTSGLIVETEAYCGATDKASHAYPNKLTPRTATMFGKAGTAYVYLCYGIHHLFNVVTNVEGKADAVLIRAVEPMEGIETMLARRKMSKKAKRLTAGPGCLSQALGISTQLNRVSLSENVIWITEGAKKIPANEVETSPRIGVDYAEEDALLPWRFTLKNSKWLSK